MRIAYISLHWPRTLSSGVGKKIHRQIETWKSFGHEARFFMHSENTRVPNLLAGEKFFYPSQSELFQREWGRIRAAKEVLRAVERFQPDLIYLRYGMYVFPIHRLIHIAPVIEEINTNDIEQHKELGFIYAFYNRLTRGIVLKRTSGLCTVSSELAGLSAFKSHQTRIELITNGIDLKNIKPFSAPNNPLPKLVFIGTPGHRWNGVDKLFFLAQKYPDLTIDIIGYKELLNYPSVPKNFKLHGYLEAKKYLEIFSKADLAIDTLALHRKKMDGTSSLKNREYLAYGLPTIFAYKDTDLDNLDVDFLLKIPNREDNILTHGKLIRDFAYKMRGKRVDREIIAPYIDTQFKEEKRLAFFEEIIKQSKQK